MKLAMLTTLRLGVLVILLGNFVAAFNICNWDGAIPKLYTEYKEDACPAASHLDHDMVCYGWDIFAHDCGSFCQIRTQFEYGPEQPFVRVPGCRAPLTCKISSNVHQGYSWKAKMNGNFKTGPLTIGITGGFSKKYAKGISSSFSVNLKSGQCGYFAFVAIIRATCGTYSESRTGVFGCDKDKHFSIGNSCIHQVARYKVSDGFPDEDVTRGIVIFVFTDCVTMEPLPDDQQDPAYRQPGVKLPRNAMSAYAQFLRKDNSAFLETQSSVCVADNKAKSLDCLDAIGQLLESPATKVPEGKKGTSRVLSKSGTCSITFDYLNDIGSACSDVTFVDVVAAAQGLYDNCKDGKGNMGGKHEVGTLKCPGAITIRKA